MACSPITLTGIALACDTGVGGLSSIYLADVTHVSGTTVSGGTVTAIAMTSTNKFKQFNFKKGNANYAVTEEMNDNNGTAFFNVTLTANFNYAETTKRTEMAALASGSVLAIAKDNNNKYWLLGKDSYLRGSVAQNSGSAWGDANNYVLTVTGTVYELPYEVASAAMTSIV